MRLKINGSAMAVSHKASVNVYHNSVGFSEKFISNNITLSNLRLQYLFTFRSNEIMFIVHQESNGKLNIYFIMQIAGCNNSIQGMKNFTFVNTVSKNKQGFMAR